MALDILDINVQGFKLLCTYDVYLGITRLVIVYDINVQATKTH